MVVMMMSLFVEHHCFYMDHELLAASAGYVHGSFVMASLGNVSEREHLERILLDAEHTEQSHERYRKYQKEPYVPEPHYKREDR